MSKNPFLNALVASAYITFISVFMTWGAHIAPKEDTVVAPIAIISLFTLSAAVMGYVFCYTPLVLYMDGKKKAAVNLFLQTVGVFAALTGVAITLMFTGVIG